MNNLFGDTREIKRDAAFSDCGKYRWWLKREWDLSSVRNHVLFCLLNPSKASGDIDDATSRRGVGFARTWGFNGYVFCNLAAYCATDPADLLKAVDPIGPLNEFHLKDLFARHRTVVAAWGAHANDPLLFAQSVKVVALATSFGIQMKCLGVTKDGYPKHILRLAYSTPLIDFHLTKTSGGAA